jgi:Icc-related predicted phosphoesterase
LKLGKEKSKRKFHRIFFATDVHASEIVFRKFIGAAKFYEADTLVMGGDITGKTLVPVVQGSNGKHHFNFQGQEFDNVAPEDLENLEGRIMNAGMYPYRVSQSEYEIAIKLAPLTSQVQTPSSCIFNVHVPPFDSNLDIAPKLDTTTNPPKPIVEGGQQVLIPVGSNAVRSTIEKMQPLLMLCGHIHETKNASQIKRTMCINPGSEYPSGLLRGVIVNLLKDKVLSYQFTSG